MAIHMHKPAPTRSQISIVVTASIDPVASATSAFVVGPFIQHHNFQNLTSKTTNQVQ